MKTPVSGKLVMVGKQATMSGSGCAPKGAISGSSCAPKGAGSGFTLEGTGCGFGSGSGCAPKVAGMKNPVSGKLVTVGKQATISGSGCAPKGAGSGAGSYPKDSGLLIEQYLLFRVYGNAETN